MFFNDRTITAVSPDGLTLTLDSPLEYEHVGESETFGTTAVELRGEVGLLSHNVKVRGSSDDQWADDIEACPDGFDTGQLLFLIQFSLKIIHKFIYFHK